MFELQSFPARDGDCLILAWGDPERPRRLMIDGGRQGTWPAVKSAIEALPENQRDFELLVVTHIDADHIAGVLKMLEDPTRAIRFKDIWFNGYHHLRPFALNENFGAEQGERLSIELQKAPSRWNRAFGHKAVVVTDSASPPQITLEGGLELTLISPTPYKLGLLEAEWADWIEAARMKPDVVIAPDPPEPAQYPPGWETFGSLPDIGALAQLPLPCDTEPPNGSSIAFIARFGAHRILLTGDAHPDVMAAALKNLTEAERRFELVKLSHHGSRNNLGVAATEWTCRNFLVSTNGSIHHHPDAQTIAHLIACRPGPKTFYFNYRHEEAAVWDSTELKATHCYESYYPTELGRLRIDITALIQPE